MSEAASKDRFFARLGTLAEEMSEAHGKDFTMGALVLAARFIAEGKQLGSRPMSDPARPAGSSQADPGTVSDWNGPSQSGT